MFKYRMTGFTNWGRLLSMLALTTIWGCQHSRPTTRTMSLSADEAACRVEIVKSVPVGTAVENAIRTMQSNGFKCSRMKDERGEFIYCNLSEPRDQFVTSRWQVKLYVADDTVSDVEVAYGTIGL